MPTRNRNVGLTLFLGIYWAASNFCGLGSPNVALASEAGQFPNPVPGKQAVLPVAKGDMVLRWNQMLLQAVRTDRTPPPLAARNMAIVHAAIYDSVNAIYRTHQFYLVDVLPQPGTLPEAAAAAAAYATLYHLYPGQQQAFSKEFAECLAQFPEGPGRDRGVDLGFHVAKLTLAWRSEDGSSNQGGYRPKKGPGFWEPTPPEFQPAMLPGWGRVKPFAMLPGTQLALPGPPPLHSAAYTRAYQEVKALGAKQGSTRTPEQTEIAIFWADGEGTSTPPGHWNQIAQTVALARGNTLAENARLFALLNISLADAGILCWLFKYHYAFWRPITAIRQPAHNGNPHTPPDPAWTPLLVTPPFPACTSGHSTFSAAGAAVLADFFGTDKVHFTTASEGLPTAKRTFSTFSAAAEEAGQSRIFGGIHWQFDNTEGLASGRALGHFVTRHYLVPGSQGLGRIKK